MEAHRAQVLTKMTSGRPPHEVQYLESFFDIAGNGTQTISGPIVVAFFKKSNVEMAILREIWSLASVYKNKGLCREEFNIFVAYVMFIQESLPATPKLNLQTLSAYFVRGAMTKLPRFENIEMPKPPVQPPPVDPFNPFNGDDGFDDFTSANTAPAAGLDDLLSIGASFASTATQPPPQNIAQLVAPNVTAFPVTTDSFMSTATQPAPQLPTELIPALEEKPKLVRDIMASMFLDDLKKEFKPKPTAQGTEVESTQAKPTLQDDGFAPFTEAVEAVPVQNGQPSSEEDNDGGWADFSGPATTSGRTQEPQLFDQMQEQTQGVVAMKQPDNVFKPAQLMTSQETSIRPSDPFGELFQPEQPTVPAIAAAATETQEDDDDFGDFNQPPSASVSQPFAAAAQPTAESLNEIFQRAPTSLAGVQAGTKEDDDGDWGEFGQYENPDDIEFPQYIKTPRESITQRSEQQDQPSEEEKSKLPPKQVSPSPQVNNLDDLLNLMQPAMNAPTVTPATIPPLDFGAFTTATEKKDEEKKGDEEDDGFDDFDMFVGAPEQSQSKKPTDIEKMGQSLPNLAEHKDDDDSDGFADFGTFQDPVSTSQPDFSKVRSEAQPPVAASFDLLDLNFTEQQTSSQREQTQTDRSWAAGPQLFSQESQVVTSSDQVTSEHDQDKQDGDDDDDDDFGDFKQWEDQNNDAAVASATETKEKSEEDDFAGAFAEESNSKVEVAAPVVEPKPFDANSLLSGFMADFGGGTRKPKPYVVPETDFNDSMFKNSPQKEMPDSGEPTTYRRDAEATQEAKALIERHFSVKNPISADTDSQLEQLLADASNMADLLEHLKVVNEFDQEGLAPVVTHYSLAEEITKAEEKKKQAAMDEDYETAAALKKQILQLKDDALTPEKLKTRYLERVPSLRNKAILDEMSKIDSSYTVQLVKGLLSSSSSIDHSSRQMKSKLVSKLLTLQSMTSSTGGGLEKVKSDLEETLQVIHEQVRATEAAQKALAYDFEELSDDERNAFTSHKKVQAFLVGIQALLMVLTVQMCTLETAEQLDSQFLMDFEAILSEARQLKQKLLGLKDQIDRLLEVENATLLCKDLDLDADGIQIESDFISTGEETPTEVSLDALITVVKAKSAETVTCQLCCQRLALGGDLCAKLPSMRPVVQNGEHYHAVCVNLWLLRKSSKSI